MIFFQNCAFNEYFFLQSLTRRKFFFQNLTRRNIFILKSDKTWNFCSGISFSTNFLDYSGTLLTLANCNKKTLYVRKILFEKILNYYHNHLDHPENNLKILLVQIQILSF